MDNEHINDLIIFALYAILSFSFIVILAAAVKISINPYMMAIIVFVSLAIGYTAMKLRNKADKEQKNRLQ
jgi:hypothetical protein